MKLLKKVRRIVIFLFLIQLLYLFYCKWFNPPITLTQIGSFITNHSLKRKYISYNAISPNARLAVIAGEDQLFPEHNGFDWNSIGKAMKWNKKHPDRVRGASTISQQTAKNIFLWQGGGWVRKGMEVYFTFMIELLYSKERILELYLNVAQMGNGIFGIECASEIYFNHGAATLSVTEAATIAACLPNPQLFTVKPISRFVEKRYPWIIQQMKHLRNEPDVAALLIKNSNEVSKP